MIEEQNASLWFSGKEMQRGKKLQDSVGKNEKTKVIVKLQKVNTCTYLVGVAFAQISWIVL